jgi:retron-type reverse transcriptase
MQKYTLNQIVKTLEKLFENNYTTTKQIKTIKWDKLDQINKNFTPVEKSLVMDFRDAVSKRKVIEFLAGKDINEESEVK